MIEWKLVELSNQFFNPKQAVKCEYCGTPLTYRGA